MFVLADLATLHIVMTLQILLEVHIASVTRLLSAHVILSLRSVLKQSHPRVKLLAGRDVQRKNGVKSVFGVVRFCVFGAE